MSSYYGNYRTRTFANIFPDYNTFSTFYSQCGVPDVLLSTAAYSKFNLGAIYFLLISRYADSHIKSADENKFKLQVMSIIYECGSAWQKEMYLQNKIVNMEDADLLTGAKSIYNHAMHPDTEPSTAQLEELEYIDDQNTTNYKKDAMRTYAETSQNLSYDICERFLKKFKKLFINVLYPDDPLLYVEEGEENV